MSKKKKQNIGEISGLEMLKKTRGINTIPFRTKVYETAKDKPRNKNWRKWVD